MKIRNLMVSAVAALAVLVGCQPQEENLGTPDISISANEMTFEVEGGDKELTVNATRDWKVTTDADWVVVSPESGPGSLEDQKVTVSVLENTGMDRSADLKFTIGMKSKYLTVSQAGPGGSVEALIVYYNNYDKAKAEKTFGSSGDRYPYLDQFDGWKNATGTGVQTVEYAYNAMSTRSNSTSDSSYSDYPGSGMNNMFFGASAYFATKNITLPAATGYTLTFGTEKYDGNNKEACFDPAEFHVYLSNDGTKWVEQTYIFAGTVAGRWNIASTDFSVPSGTTNLSICIKVDAASVYRMDDLKLVISEGGDVVDFSKGVEMDFTGGGNQGGGDTPGTPSDGNAIYSNNFDKVVSSKNSSGNWPYCNEFDGWKNEAGSGAANVTYTFKSASARATSGNNNIWLPKSGAYFTIQNIALNSASSLELSFSVICGSPGNYKKTFSSDVFKVYLSNDNAKWVEMPVSVTANGTEFDSAIATFSVPSNTATLSIAFEKIADETDGYRIDNVNLVASENAGTAVDFSAGTEIDFSEGGTGGNTGGNTGGGQSGQPATLVKATIAEFLAAAEDDTWYELTGEIINIAKTDYGNFTIKDATGEVYIYGMTSKWVGSNDKSFSQIGLKVGDTVTLGSRRTSYQGTPQGGGNPVPAFYISHVPGEGGEDPVTPPAGGEGQYEPNITWTLGTNAYDNTSTGTNTQTATVNGVSVKNLLKLGTGSKVGDATLHVPAGTAKIGFYCVAWKGKKAQVKFSVGGTEITTINPAANVGATGNAPYTALNVADSDYYEVELPAGTTDIKVETLDPSNGRALFVGLKAF
ncbi:MAG: BACON domain-containing protein [Bacteroidales bacterium]|nr:BACON domain-containing protein [Bacteroidales bacterium]